MDANILSIGAYACPGKLFATTTVTICLRAIASEFDVSFAPGETGEVFDSMAQDTFTTTLPPLQLLFTPRQSK